jgi:hypothetical protein
MPFYGGSEKRDTHKKEDTDANENPAIDQPAEKPDKIRTEFTTAVMSNGMAGVRASVIVSCRDE